MENFVNIQPTVTIMVTFYNQKKYIGECLESILNQKTNFYFEILCGDDGSADGTYEELLFWERHYPMAFYILYLRTSIYCLTI